MAEIKNSNKPKIRLLTRVKNQARLIVQIVFTALTNGYLRGFGTGTIYQGPLKYACVPGLNCYSCPGALGSCPIGALQAVLGSWKFSMAHYVVGFLIFVGAVLGRVVCGFLCPFGLVQDLLNKIPVHKIPGLRRLKRNSLPGHKYLRWLKYVMLITLVILAPLFLVDLVGQGAPYFCQYVCPSGTLLGGWTLPLLDSSVRNAIGWLYAWKSTLLIAIILLSLFIYRPFCKYLCPLGAIYALFNRIALVRHHLSTSKCTNCHLCAKACPMDIPLPNALNHPECIRCNRCMKACPHGAISYVRKK